MDNDQEKRIRELAYSLWQTAERPYWVALEYWLMAEKMVVEMMAMTRDELERRSRAAAAMLGQHREHRGDDDEIQCDPDFLTDVIDSQEPEGPARR